jgi:Na+/H+ antiporter NhaC
MSIFYNTVSCVLAGAVLGDHCSPISDTTILSSMASGCNHLDHVKTQMPYALTVAVVGLVAGTLPAALGLNPWLCLGAGIVGCIAVIEMLGKKSRKRVFDESDSGD